MNFKLNDLPDYILEEVSEYLPIDEILELRCTNKYIYEVISIVIFQRGVIKIGYSNASLDNKVKFIKQKGHTIKNLVIENVRKIIPFVEYLNNLASLNVDCTQYTELLDLLAIKQDSTDRLKKVNLNIISFESQYSPNIEGRSVPIFKIIEDIKIQAFKMKSKHFNFVLSLFNTLKVKKIDIDSPQSQTCLDKLQRYTQLTTLKLSSMESSYLSVTKDFEFSNLKKFGLYHFCGELEIQFYILNKLLTSSNLRSFKFFPDSLLIEDQEIVNNCFDNSTINFDFVLKLNLPFWMLDLKHIYFPNLIKLTIFHQSSQLYLHLWDFISNRKELKTLKFNKLCLRDYSKNCPRSKITNITKIIFKDSSLQIKTLALLLESFENLQIIKFKNGSIHNNKPVKSKRNLVQKKLFIIVNTEDNNNFINIMKYYFDHNDTITFYPIQNLYN